MTAQRRLRLVRVRPRGLRPRQHQQHQQEQQLQHRQQQLQLPGELQPHRRGLSRQQLDHDDQGTEPEPEEDRDILSHAQEP